MFVVDTDVLSASSPLYLAPDPVRQWLSQHRPTLYLCAVTVAEVEQGISKAIREGATRKASRLSFWLEGVLLSFTDRVLPFDLPASRHFGRLAEQARRAGFAPDFPDLAIAAIARHHGFTVATRNTRHFAPMGIPVLDPFAPPPRT